jgi:hypothetical protein
MTMRSLILASLNITLAYLLFTQTDLLSSPRELSPQETISRGSNPDNGLCPDNLCSDLSGNYKACENGSSVCQDCFAADSNTPDTYETTGPGCPDGTSSTGYQSDTNAVYCGTSVVWYGVCYDDASGEPYCFFDGSNNELCFSGQPDNLPNKVVPE